VSSRLRLPAPPADAARTSWPIRRVDIDPLHHVNNAAQWAIIEESLPPDESRRGVAEVEHRAAVDAEATLERLTADDDAGRSSWLVSNGTVLTAARWSPAR
jgi:acyl-ACP thioesterase